MKLVIITQHEENYGAHDWNGEGACPQYWKSKGGDFYVVENVLIGQQDPTPYKDLCKVLVRELGDLIQRSDDYFQEYIIRAVIVGDSEKLWEDYDSPIYLRREDKSWRARQLQDGATCGMHRSIKQCITEYTLLPKGEQAGRSVLYITDKGALNYAEWLEKYSNCKTVDSTS